MRLPGPGAQGSAHNLTEDVEVLRRFSAADPATRPGRVVGQERASRPGGDSAALPVRCGGASSRRARFK
jgi:hypothetical protein